MIDYAALKANHHIEEVVGRYVRLRRSGSAFEGQCPFHKDVTPSLKVNLSTQRYKCFGCGESGDMVDFVKRIEGIDSDTKAVEIIAGNVSSDYVPVKHEAIKEWTQINPAPFEPDLSRVVFKGQPISKAWAYHNADGSLNCYDVRVDYPDGSKDVLPYSYGHIGDEPPRWRFRGADRPRPLYNLQKVIASSIVIIGEGCKTADSIQGAFSKAAATTWPLGWEGVRYVDITPLKGKQVYFWPDFDIQGLAAANILAYRLESELNQPLKIIRTPSDMPRGWDHADSGWSPEETKAWVRDKANVFTAEVVYDSIIECPVGEKPPKRLYLDGEAWRLVDPKEGDEVQPPAPTAPEPPADEPPVERHVTPVPQPHEHFTVMGWERAELGKQYYVFFQNDKKAIIRKTAESIGKSALLELAPLQWWLDRWDTGKGKIDEDAVKDALIRQAEMRGIFDMDRVRGRGAWIDQGHVVLHTGSSLIVDGKQMALGDFRGRYFYEVSKSFDFELTRTATTAEAARFLDFCKQLPWDRDISAYLLAGWCVIAPVCGALKWRPHIWITGPAGSGKSFTLRHVIRDMVGFCALPLQGKSSEPGIRQTLGVDSVPVVFDEAEANTQKSTDNIENILQLVRSASSDDGGDIVLGSSSGMSKTFKIRSCFAFASIAVPLVNQSDKRRVSVLGMNRQFKHNESDITAMWQETCPDGFREALFSRTLGMLPTIMANIRTFTKAAAVVLGDQAVGDQLGAMLAGAYSLTSKSEVSYEDAVAWVSARDWSQEMASQTRDEMELLNLLLDQSIEVQDATSGVKYRRTVAEMVEVAAGRNMHDPSGITPASAEANLRRLGIKVEDGAMIVSNSAPQIKNWLKGTAFAINHNKILVRVNGAEELPSVRFSGGVRTRAVRVPLDVIYGK